MSFVCQPVWKFFFKEAKFQSSQTDLKYPKLQQITKSGSIVYDTIYWQPNFRFSNLIATANFLLLHQVLSKVF